MRLADVLPRLKSVDWGSLGVCHAVIYGSLAKRGEGRDVDILIVWCSGEGDLVSVAVQVADAVGADPSEVDVVDLERAPCPIVQDALGGVVAHTVDRSALIDAIVRKAEICWDWEITMKKLRIIETAVNSAKRRWGSWGSS